jgi:hypothetical protein
MTSTLGINDKINKPKFIFFDILRYLPQAKNEIIEYIILYFQHYFYMFDKILINLNLNLIDFHNSNQKSEYKAGARENPDLDLYGYWQTQQYEPPYAQNGKVPRNEFGNVELFQPCMLPRGCVHLRNMPNLVKVCRKLNIDCAAAVVGFDAHGGFSHAVYDGWVLCEEFKETVTAAYIEEEREANRKMLEKKQERILHNWKHLVKSLLIREKLQLKYDGFSNKKVIKAKSMANDLKYMANNDKFGDDDDDESEKEDREEKKKTVGGKLNQLWSKKSEIQDSNQSEFSDLKPVASVQATSSSALLNLNKRKAAAKKETDTAVKSSKKNSRNRASTKAKGPARSKRQNKKASEESSAESTPDNESDENNEVGNDDDPEYDFKKSLRRRTRRSVAASKKPIVESNSENVDDDIESNYSSAKALIATENNHNQVKNTQALKLDENGDLKLSESEDED